MNYNKDKKISKNIWILNHYAKTPDMSGGTRHYDLGSELTERGYNVTIFASAFDHDKKEYIKINPKERYRIENYHGVKFVWINTISYDKNNWKRILNMLSYSFRILGIAKNVNKPDVIIGSSVHPFAVIAAWWLARRYKARFIFEVRDLWPQTPVDMGIMKPNSVMAKFLYIWEKFMYKKAEKIITLLPNAKDYITKLGIDLDKIVCIPNGVNLKNYDNYLENIEVPEIDSFIKKNDKKFKIIYAGAHGPANGLDVVINAAEILEKEDPDVHFLMAGDGVDKNRIIENAKKIKITNITFLDSVKKSQVPIVLKSADLLLHCLKDLNVFKHGISPNKLNDYMASAKPIIMSVKASNDIVEEANAGLTVEPENPKALVEAIIKIKNMTPEERKEMGENGRRYVEKFHSIKVLADKLEAII